MTTPPHHPSRIQRLSRLGSVSVVVMLVCGILAAQSFAGTFEQVKTFEQASGQSNLSGSNGLAVNVGGVGGIPAGTLFAASTQTLLTRYEPDGTFVAKLVPPENYAPFAIAIDQANGNIYALGHQSSSTVVQVFNPKGTELLARFGDSAAFAASIEESPAQFHTPEGITVDEAGTVYVSDEGNAFAEPSGQQSRVMVFKPTTPGDVTTYKYAGRANDLAASNGSIRYGPKGLAVDDQGHLFTSEDQALYEFPTSAPAAPLCTLSLTQGGIEAMAVNSASGRVIYDSTKNGKGHELACSGGGTFQQTGEFSITPKPTDSNSIKAIAVNPSLEFEHSGAVGTLYLGSNSGLGYIFAPKTTSKPAVGAESVAAVTATSATLRAQINPGGVSTNYVFQVLPSTMLEGNEPGDPFHGASEVPVGGAGIGGGHTDVGVAVTVTGLNLATNYTYRVVATNNEGTAAGTPETFSTYSAQSGALPDGRSYELVSPVQKNGGEVFPLAPNIGSCGNECKPGTTAARFPMQAEVNGESIVYEGYPFSNSGAVHENQYIAHRTSAGWIDTTLSRSLQDSGEGRGFLAFNPSLTSGLLYQGTPVLTPTAPAEYPNLYGQSTASPSLLEPLLLVAPPNREMGTAATGLKFRFGGASQDLSQVFFAANDSFAGETAFAPASVDGGYAKYNLYESSSLGLRLANVAPGNAGTAPGAAFVEGPNAVSADGSHAFWTSPGGQLFVRIDGEKTEQIVDPGKFLAASSDGSTIVLNDGCLYQLRSASCLDLTENESGQSLGGFVGLVGESTDLSRIYFVDTEPLTVGAPAGQSPIAGEDNLYYWNDGVTTFVATGVEASDWASPVVALRTAQASPDGNWLAFISKVPLTGFSNVGPHCADDHGEPVSGPCPEAFLFNGSTKHLVCVSCGETGTGPLGRTSLPTIPGALSTIPQPHYLTNAGRVFFDTQNSLSQFDTNGGGPPGRAVEDVYETEPVGVGSCADQPFCTSLVSAGTGSGDSNFFAADASGANVFFVSRDQLTPLDQDEQLDLYDAREGGGIPAESESSPPGCRGEACQLGLAGISESLPASSSVQAHGKRPVKKCNRRQVRRHKSCVKAERRKHRKRHGSNQQRGNVSYPSGRSAVKTGVHQ